MINRLLVANRGEIACRIIRTAKALGIHCIAVYSEPDRNALFVKNADEAYCIGQAEPSQSYLNINKLIDIAKASSTQAIHPGYGFLSENAEFAERCEQEGILFIGPSAEVIRKMGSKGESKTLLEKAGIPLTPGYHGLDQSISRFLDESKKIGFPILIKASAGGGGKGMRVVNESSEVESAIQAAKREALSSFGDDRLLLERYILNPRHVEVQIFCDQQGNAVYLNDRDCSLQRRHQKVIEEAPAPGLTAATRHAMGETAIKCALSIGYEGAGTVEFLVDPDEHFYFMEMNTRLQVEHPVTEMITEYDLVEWQIRVAQNEPLPVTQSQIPCLGHAIEARIYAEDPSQDFLPDAGHLIFLNPPPNNPHCRIDTGIRQGDEISIHYDPMISKLIVWAETREKACQLLHHQLSHYHISGIKTNIGFLNRLTALPAFHAAHYDTGFISNHPDLCTVPMPSNDTLMAAAALYLARSDHSSFKNSSPWNKKHYWRSSIPATENIELQTGEHNIKLQATTSSAENGEALWKIITIKHGEPDLSVNLSFTCRPDTITITSDSRQGRFYYHWHKTPGLAYPTGVTLFEQGEAYFFQFPAQDNGEDYHHDTGSLLAPMHGKIIALIAPRHTAIKKGDPLLIVEAMKMEHTLYAPTDGHVKEYLCDEGDNVECDQVLIDFLSSENEQIKDEMINE